MKQNVSCGEGKFINDSGTLGNTVTVPVRESDPLNFKVYPSSFHWGKGNARSASERHFFWHKHKSPKPFYDL